MRHGPGSRGVLQLMAAVVMVSLGSGCERTEAANGELAATVAPLRGAYWREVSVLPAPAPSFRATTFDSLRGKLVLVQYDGLPPRPPHVRTWEWDGQQWLDRTAPNVIAPSSTIGWSVYDSSRDRVVHLDYRECGTETWEWDGASWTRFDVAGPALHGSFGQSSFGDIAFDSARARVVWSGVMTNNIAETWEWDGTRWERRAASYGRGRMAFDRKRQRVVAFDGSTLSEWDGTTWTERGSVTAPASGLLGYDSERDVWVLIGATTWEFSGGIWVERAPGSTLSGGVTGDRLEYDSARKRMVLIGDGSHWEWDGTTWTLRIAVPPARTGHGMVFDEARREVIMLGGVEPPNGAMRDDMWAWDGAVWRERSVPLPPARAFHAMAYDRDRQRVVVFGGSGRADTWEWDGVSWLERPVAGPPDGPALTMTYDSVRRVALLFTGVETWTWDGTSWTRLEPETTPSQRNASIAFDDSRRVAVLVGTFESPTQFSQPDETWEWDGTNWIQRFPESPPPAQRSPGIAYDSARQLVVAYGGNRWLNYVPGWDGTNWFGGAAPPLNPRLGAALAYDSARRSIVMFGGFDRFAYSRGTRDTWETALEGAPCSSTADCSSGNCVDGVCCDTQESSCGECKRCDVPGSVGTCTPSDGLSCTDGDACTVNDRCVGGACVPEYTTVCVTEDECSPVGACDPATGQCPPPQTLPDRTPCSDGWVCRSGSCINQCKNYMCSESDWSECYYVDAICVETSCFVPEACDPFEGCIGRTLDNGSPCAEPNWGDPGRCMDGTCERIPPCEGLENGASCMDGHPPQLGRCQDGFCQWINPCEGADDGTPCPSVIDDPRAICRSGNCQLPFECTSEFCGENTECRVLKECADTSCVFEELEGTPCSGGFCRSGFCQPDLCLGVVCPLDSCAESATCDPFSGGCSYVRKPDGTRCDDNNACTRVDTCLNGWCSGGDSVQCEQPTPRNPCVPPVVCDPATGLCPEVEPPADAGMPPNDGGAADGGAADGGGAMDGGIADAGAAGSAGVAGGSAGQGGGAGTPEAGTGGGPDAGEADAGDPHGHGHKPHRWHCATVPASRGSSAAPPLLGALIALSFVVRTRRRRSHQTLAR